MEGKIIAKTKDHLYVDFGCKFHGVVKRPKPKSEPWLIDGSRVRVLVKDLEITGHFQGASKHRSMLEADIKLTPCRAKQKTLSES